MVADKRNGITFFADVLNGWSLRMYPDTWDIPTMEIIGGGMAALSKSAVGPIWLSCWLE